MPQPGIWRPLIVLAAGIALTVVMLARTEDAVSIARFEGYPEQTLTAYAISQAQGSNPPAGATAAPTWTWTPTATSTSSPSPTVSPTAFVRPTVRTAIPTTPTPTPAGSLSCTPGTTILIEGSGPPRAPILLMFGTRVVGGGSVSPGGTFSLPLTLGIERPGQHEVTVRIRGTDRVLREVDCGVPAVTPTPLPTRPPAP